MFRGVIGRGYQAGTERFNPWIDTQDEESGIPLTALLDAGPLNTPDEV
jgi:hypothetical protein